MMEVIHPGELHVWHASADTACGADGHYLSLLSVEEAQRAKAFRFERDRTTYVLGKAMARTLLGNILNVPPSTIRFFHGAYGKPGLAPELGLGFNLSHAGQHVLFAFAVNRDLGVDIESESRDADVMGMARRYFCHNEILRLEACPPEGRTSVFFKYWTFKEAYLKADGSGIGTGLNSVDVSAIDDRTPADPIAPLEDVPRGILVQRLSAPSGYAAAVAARGGRWTLKTSEWTTS